jgi:hypothetical protein
MKKPKFPRLPKPYPSDVSDDEWSAGCFEAMAHDLRILLRACPKPLPVSTPSLSPASYFIELFHSSQVHNRL